MFESISITRELNPESKKTQIFGKVMSFLLPALSNFLSEESKKNFIDRVAL
jgi:hypothetical protein